MKLVDPAKPCARNTMPLFFVVSLKVKVIGVLPTNSLTFDKFASENLSFPNANMAIDINNRQSSLYIEFLELLRKYNLSWLGGIIKSVPECAAFATTHDSCFTIKIGIFVKSLNHCSIPITGQNSTKVLYT